MVKVTKARAWAVARATMEKEKVRVTMVVVAGVAVRVAPCLVNSSAWLKRFVE